MSHVLTPHICSLSPSHENSQRWRAQDVFKVSVPTGRDSFQRVPQGTMLAHRDPQVQSVRSYKSWLTS
jgi:hypothetical protein